MFIGVEKIVKKQFQNYLQKPGRLRAVSDDFVAAVDDSSEHIDCGDLLVEALEFFADGVALSSLLSCMNFRNQDRLKVKIRSFVILQLINILVVVRS